MLTGDLVDVNVTPLHSARAEDAGFSVRGQGARIDGDQRTGIRSVMLGATSALTDFATNLPPADLITVSPVYTDRSLADWGSERSFVPSKLPLALVRWQPARAQTLALSWSAPGPLLSHSPQELVIGAQPPITFSTGVPVSWIVEPVGTQLRIHLKTEIGAGEKFVLGVSALSGRIAAEAMARTRAADWQRLLQSSPMVELAGLPDAQWLRALHESNEEELRDRLRAWIGFDPDPERERVVLRPIVQPDQPRVAIRRLDLGGAWLDVEWTIDDRRVLFELTLSYGNLNPRVIMEPMVPARVAAVRVDGQPAQLSLREENGWTICPVQLVLDHPRRIEIELA